MEKLTENEFCECKGANGVYSVIGEWGYWLHCDKCKRKKEDEFHYHSEELEY